MRRNNERGRSEVPLSILQGHVSALWRDKNLSADSKQKPFDDISAISVVDAGMSHRVVFECVQVTVAVPVWLNKRVPCWRQRVGGRACQTFASMLSQIPLLSPYLDTPVHPGNACSHASMHCQHSRHKYTAPLIGLPFLPTTIHKIGVPQK